MKNNVTDSEVKAALMELKPYFKKALIFTVIANFLSLAPVGYMRDVYGPVVNSRSHETLFYVTLLLLSAVVIKGLLDWVRSRLFAAASVALGIKLSERVFDATFRSNLNAGSSGSKQALQHLKTIRSFIASPATGILFDAPVALFFLALVFYINTRLGIVATFAAITMFVITVLTERSIQPVISEAQQASVEALNYVNYSSRNAQVIEAMGMLESVHDGWRSIQSRFIIGQAEASDQQVLGSVASKFIMMSQGSFVIGIGSWLTINGYLRDGGAAMIIASILGMRAIQPMMQLVSTWKQISMVKVAYQELDSFLRKQPLQQESMSLPAPKGHLSLDKVSVRTPDRKTVILQDITFQLPAGKTLAVIGPSGSGKSTLAKVLVGLWPAASGSARLDGSNIFRWNKVELGPHLGYLPQDIELFDGTLAENIARFGEFEPEKVFEALRLVGLDGLVKDLPDGIDSKIGDEGLILSGGQRQRVGLARAVYGNPRLIVLDEPNSSLDQEGEAALRQTLMHLKAMKSSVIIISHRPEILQLADAILMLKMGFVRFFGPRDKILEKLAGLKAKAKTTQAPVLSSFDAAQTSNESEAEE